MTKQGDLQVENLKQQKMREKSETTSTWCGKLVSLNEINKNSQLTQPLDYSEHDGRTKTSSGGWKSNTAQHKASSISPRACASLPSRHRGSRRVDIRNEGSTRWWEREPQTW
ncbi:hypothetical protein K443DRAFT_597386 [Laccaria amethystina LaAM-08-1]|uniref:Uncharacterized protein n=1 Tax=Laccaria amethystina LaAM-08-1 TaxID=1095629 RepID=A0A0C9XSG1_9AGAR|nr:hypothetical protein K443DRAFT_597386 [Laccaria amethystina LaAM-08-1]